MKALVVSDLHANRAAYELFEELIKRELPDVIFMLGDYFGHENEQCIAILNKYASKIVGVCGNCDSKADLDRLNFHCAPSIEATLNGRRVILLHGHDINEMKKYQLNTDDVVIMGHSHMPRIEKLKGIYMLNPGSLYMNRSSDTNPTYIILTNDDIRLYKKGGLLLNLKDY